MDIILSFLVGGIVGGIVGFIAGFLVMRKHYAQVKATEAGVKAVVDTLKG